MAGKILIVGSAGSIGKALSERFGYGGCLEWDKSSYPWEPRDVLQNIGEMERQFRYVKTIYHCAGLKFVDECECRPMACVEDNVLTTYMLLRAAYLASVKHFVFLSTDKASEPVSLMGYAKRMSEAMVLKQGYSVIRLVNVKETRGNVFEKWKQAKESGQTIPVTHRDMTRYFMSLNEAVQAILDVSTYPAGLYAWRPDQATSVWELAKRYGDPVEVGMRPGEKLHESLGNPDEIWEPVKGFLHRCIS